MPKAIEGAREAILAAARRLLAQDGYEKLNIRAIATESGMGTGTVYNYYRAKDEIVFALMRYDWQEALSLMDAALAGAPSRTKRLRAIFDRLHEFSSKYAAVWRLMAGAPAEAKSPSLKGYSTASFVAEIAQRIKTLLEENAATKDAADMAGHAGHANVDGLASKTNIAGLANLIAKVFSLFSMEKNADYAAIDLLLEKLLGQETDQNSRPTKDI